MCWQESKTCHHDSRVKIRVKGANTSATAKVHRGSPVHFWLAIVYKTAMASAGLAVYAAVLAIPMKKSYGFSKSGTTFWKVVPLSSGNGYLPAVWAVFVKKSYDFLVGTALLRVRMGVPRVSTFQKIAFTFTIPYLQGLWAPFPAFDVSQTFHTWFVKAMWNVCAPSRPQETPANLYLQGLSASTVKVKAIFWKVFLVLRQFGW